MHPAGYKVENPHRNQHARKGKMDKKPVNKKIEDIYPLSPMQQGMLFHALYDPDSSAYFIRSSFTIQGKLNIDAFKKAWEHIGRSNPLFRTLFRWENVNEPVQIVLRDRAPEFTVHDFSHLDDLSGNAGIDTFLKEDRAKPFDLSKWPLMRLNLFILGDDTYHFVWSYHHILMDGWCLSLVITDFFMSYTAIAKGQTPPLLKRPLYKNYISWLKKQNREKTQSYWRELLHDVDSPTPLPADFKPANRKGFRVAKRSLLLAEEITVKLQELTREKRATLNTLIQSAWALLLGRYSMKEDVIFGSVISGRPSNLAGSEEMVGLFINSLPVRVKIEKDTTLSGLLAELQKQSLKIQEFGYSFLPDIKACSRIPGTENLFNSRAFLHN